MKISTKLSVYYAVLMVLIIGGVAMVYYAYTKSSIHGLNINNLSQTCASAMTQVDGRLTNMEQVAVDVLSSNQFTDAWKQAMAGDAEAESVIRGVMTRAFVNKGDIRRVSVFGANGLFYSTGVCTATADGVRARWGDIEETYSMNYMYGRTFLGPHLDNWHPESGTYVISEIKPIKDGRSRVIGYLEVQQNVMYIDRICNLSWNNGRLDTFVFVEKDELFYTNLPRWDESEAYIREIQELTSVYTKVREAGGRVICTATSNYYDCRVVTVVEQSALDQALDGMLRGLILGVAVLVLLTMGYILFITNRMMEPINLLVRRMGETDLENFHSQKQSYNNTHSYETRVLITAFEQMRVRLGDAMEARRRMEDVQTKALFSILQSEISPHFLYNTLGSIANMCEKGESDAAADACYSLTELLRYSSNYAVYEVTVREELDNLRAYLAVMKSRYRGRLTFELIQDPATGPLMLPKLTYQPLVENAIKYSLMERETVSVRVYTMLLGRDLYIEIKDNGCGITEKAAREVRRKVEEFRHSAARAEMTDQLQFGGMGLSGTLIRLSIFFGNDFRYELLRHNDEGGATIVLHIRADNN